MSGGAFDYSFHQVSDFADKVKNILDKQGVKNEYGDSYYTYSVEVQAKFREIADKANLLSSLMKEVEWLVSGDTGEETFMKRIKEIEG